MYRCVHSLYILANDIYLRYRVYIMQNDTLTKFLVRVIAIILCFPIHESAHAWVAAKLGDPTGRNAGRISLNPVVHMDMWGTLCFLFLGIGYARPVPVNIGNFRRPKAGFALTALAGPVSNLIMAFLCLLVLRIFLQGGASAGFVDYLYTGLIYAAYINVSLAVFNMIPIPPLDGSRLVTAVLPDRLYGLFLKYERYSAFALLILLFIMNRAGVSPVSAVSGAFFGSLARLAGL